MNDNFLNSLNAPYVAELFFKFKEDSNSIDQSWIDFFQTLNDDELSILGDFGGPEWKKRPSNVIDDVSFDKVIRSVADVDSFKTSTLDSIRALRLIRAFRINGHLIANLDPLDKWHDKEEYESVAKKLNQLFNNNISAYN